MTYLLDTSVIVDLLRKKPEIFDFVRMHSEDALITSSACAFELWSGIYRLRENDRSSRSGELEGILLSFSEVVPFSHSQAKIAGSLYAELSQKGIIIDDLDILIAAAALSKRATLVTRNPKHFLRIPTLEVVSL